MTHISTHKWLAIATVLLVLGALAVVAAPAQAQGDVCGWDNIGQSSKNLHHMGYAMDTDANVFYMYGGLDDQFEAQSTFEEADVSNAANLQASHKTVNNPGALKLMGSAGAYRAKGADADDSAVYFFGGMGDMEKGNTSGGTQRYLTKSGSWERVSVSGLDERAFAGAAYDPDHDVIWVVGGVGSCSLVDVYTDGDTCQARSISTQYLSFDATTGDPMWNTLSGGDQSIYGHTLVYDSAGKRLLLFGGTTNISRGSNKVMALNLSDPDPAKAQWASVSTSGTAPTVYFHAAAYDAKHNWMIVYGGAKSDFLQDRESTDTRTYALDLGATPNPAWVDLKTTLGDRVGGAMGYTPLHETVIFTLGRKVIEFEGDPAEPAPSIQRSTHALVCVQPTAVPPTTVPPTDTPGTPGAPTAVDTTVPPTQVPSPDVCDFVTNRVPSAVINAAISNPTSIQGYNELQNPGVPESPYNIRRLKLSLRNISAPWHPLYNGLIYKAGCP